YSERLPRSASTLQVHEHGPCANDQPGRAQGQPEGEPESLHRSSNEKPGHLLHGEDGKEEISDLEPIAIQVPVILGVDLDRLECRLDRSPLRGNVGRAGQSDADLMLA